jgi:hypothetical protein
MQLSTRGGLSSTHMVALVPQRLAGVRILGQRRRHRVCARAPPPVAPVRRLRAQSRRTGARPMAAGTCARRYVVLNRPFAFVQWLAKADIPEAYVLMSEPDHVWLRPMPNLMAGERVAAFPFFYIEPAKPEFKHITEKFTGPLTRRQAEAIAPMGAWALQTRKIHTPRHSGQC